MKSLFIFFVFIFSILFIQSKIPYEIELKGLESMVDASKPYSDFEAYQEYYQKENGVKILHPMMETFTRPTETLIDSPEEVNLSIQRGRYLCYLADYGYCYPEDIEKGKCCYNSFPHTRKDITTSNGWTLIDYGRSTTKDTKMIFTNNKNYFAILRNDIFKKVVITYPGTRDNVIQMGSEIINSKLIDFALRKFSPEIQMSQYFGFRAECIMENVFTPDNIKNMKLSEGYQVIFVGHSLGGATAAATLLFALDRDIVTRSLNHPVLVTYGQPRTGNEAFALTLQKEAEVIYRYVNSNDVIPFMPFYDWGYRQTNGKIYIEGNNTEYTVKSSIFNYEINKINDEQEFNTGDILVKLATNSDRHLYYFAFLLSDYCIKN